jgi:hypothetical protein
MPLYQSRLVRPSLPALAAGAILLIVGSLMRVAGQPSLGGSPIAGASLTVLVFLVPALVAGALAPRAAILDGIILGLIGAAFVTLQIAGLRPDWSSFLLYETMGLFACLSVPLCMVGAVVGGRLFRARLR